MNKPEDWYKTLAEHSKEDVTLHVGDLLRMLHDAMDMTYHHPSKSRAETAREVSKMMTLKLWEHEQPEQKQTRGQAAWPREGSWEDSVKR